MEYAVFRIISTFVLLTVLIPILLKLFPDNVCYWIAVVIAVMLPIQMCFFVLALHLNILKFLFRNFEVWFMLGNLLCVAFTLGFLLNDFRSWAACGCSLLVIIPSLSDALPLYLRKSYGKSGFLAPILLSVILFLVQTKSIPGVENRVFNFGGGIEWDLEHLFISSSTSIVLFTTKFCLKLTRNPTELLFLQAKIFEVDDLTLRDFTFRNQLKKFQESAANLNQA